MGNSTGHISWFDLTVDDAEQVRDLVKTSLDEIDLSAHRDALLALSQSANDPDRAQELGRRKARLEEVVGTLDRIDSGLNDSAGLLELAEAEDDDAPELDKVGAADPLRAELDRAREERALQEREWRARFAEARARVRETEARCWREVNAADASTRRGAPYFCSSVQIAVYICCTGGEQVGRNVPLSANSAGISVPTAATLPPRIAMRAASPSSASDRAPTRASSARSRAKVARKSSTSTTSSSRAVCTIGRSSP